MFKPAELRQSRAASMPCLDQVALRSQAPLASRLWSITNVRLCESACVSKYVCYTPIMKRKKKKKRQKIQHTIWYVIMYESVLVLFQFG